MDLALVKRYTELFAARAADEARVPGRAYLRDDRAIIPALGGAAGYLAVLVLALYIENPATLHMYSRPKLIWLACPALLYWLSRIWFIAHRGQMHDDPLVFALKDRSSLIVAVVLAVVFVLAR
jgi:hypothetical protein